MPSKVAERPVVTPRIAAFRSFSYVRFRFYWVGTLLFYSATTSQQVARAWLVLEETDSAFYVSLVAALHWLPMLLFVLVGGLLADRLDRRRLILTSDTLTFGSYLLLGVLVISDRVEVWQVMALAFVGGAGGAFSMPARQIFLQSLVPREDLPNAIALQMAIFAGASTVGPALGGFLVRFFDVSPTLFIGAAMSIPAIVVMLLLRSESSAAQPRRSTTVQDMLAGFRYLRHSSVVTPVILMGAVATVFGMPFQALAPIFAKDVLDVGSDGLGILLAAAGVGSVLGAIFVASLGRAAERSSVMALAGVTFGLFLVGFSLSSIYGLSIFLMLVMGYAFQVFFSANLILVQTHAPQEILGRVLSLRMAMWGLTPIGTMSIGAIAEVAGAPATLAVSGALETILVLSIYLAAKEMRKV